MDKTVEPELVAYENGETSADSVVGVKSGTVRDMEDMKRLGKKQVFKRNFGFYSILGFSLVVMSTWEAVLATILFGLSNGGLSGLIYTFLAAWVIFILVIAAMAELASMAPTSGGQYHWISEFAPPKYQRQLSYFVGWLSVLGWQAGTAIAAYGAGTMIQGLVVLNYVNYDYHAWHGTLIAMCITVLVAMFNIFLANHLPLVEGLILVMHLVGFFAIMIPLWVLAPRTPSAQVWNTFDNEGGWPNIGTACMVGMITPVGAFVGGDAAAHMSEELRNASKTLPRAMFTTIIFNGALGFIMLVTLCYTLGDVESALESPTGYPIIEILYNATGSYKATNGLMSIIIILGIAGNLTLTAGASRQLFAFARDGAVPFPSWVSKVPVGWDIPINAVIVTAIFSSLMECIRIGSDIAFNVIISIGTVSLLSSYITCIACLAYRRWQGTLLESYFSLGKFGLPLNLLAIVLLLVVTVMAFFPSEMNPTPAEMNWAVAVYGGVLLIAFVYYIGWARHLYVSPLDRVKHRAGEMIIR